MKLRILHPQYWLPNLKKKIFLRISVLSLFGIAWLLVDEYIKQGYFFNPDEITLIGSHESMITALAIVALVSLIIHKLRGGDKRG